MNEHEARVQQSVGSLEALCEEAVCTANFDLMVALGFPRRVSETLCSVVREKALAVGVNDLTRYYEGAKERGGPTIINRLIRTFHRTYLASRANLHPSVLLDYLAETTDKDLCFFTLARALKVAEPMLLRRREALARKKATRLDVDTLLADDE